MHSHGPENKIETSFQGSVTLNCPSLTPSHLFPVSSVCPTLIYLRVQLPRPLCSENTRWEIPKTNKSYVFNAMSCWVAWWNLPSPFLLPRRELILLFSVSTHCSCSLPLPQLASLSVIRATIVVGQCLPSGHSCFVQYCPKAQEQWCWRFGCDKVSTLQ